MKNPFKKPVHLRMEEYQHNVASEIFHKFEIDKKNKRLMDDELLDYKTHSDHLLWTLNNLYLRQSSEQRSSFYINRNGRFLMLK